MRRRILVALVAALALAPRVDAKFGMSKTKVILPRLRPPESPLMAESVAVDVRAGGAEITQDFLALVRAQVEGALRSAEVYQVVDRGREADATVRIRLDTIHAEIRDEIRMETQRVKVGEREEWDDKKKKTVYKDVYADRQVPVSWRVADGSLSASVEVEGPDGPHTTDAGGSYHDQFKTSDAMPPEATDESSLRRFLVQQTAGRAVGVVTFAPDPVEALLAVNGELKDGNRYAEAGLWEQALESWSLKTYKGGTEAARLHNVGVGHEALAYKFPPYTPEHRSQLEQARDLYKQAQALDPGEKYFRDPPLRAEVSLQYAAAASLFMSELDQYRDEKKARRRSPSRKDAPRPKAPVKHGAPVSRP
jgi:hypothetical protein